MNRILTTAALAVCVITGSLFYYNKNVQAQKSKEAFSALKDDYLNQRIDYKLLSTKINDLEKTGSYKADNSEIKSLETIEKQRSEFKNIEEQFAKKNYNYVLPSIASLEKQIEDKILKNKLLELKGAVEDSVSDDLNQYITDSKYDEGLKLLEENKEYLPKDFLDSNKKLIEAAQLKEQEEKKQLEANRKEAEEKAKKTVSPAIAAYLNGYKPNPDKENVVKNYSSRSKFLVWVDLQNQKTNVFVGSKGDWKIIKELDCSTGAEGSETPKGIFKVSARGDWFYNASINEGAKNWVQFFGNYLFHSWPMDKNENITDYTLGKPVSHGCVRLSLENSKWIFNNIPGGTTVYVN
ncbi:L,D-transpeptidase family protein [Clostridium sp. YIM B02505]|uniref:L,D-transpeptidase family protein n=1 Tax=Clostridium yunnanense TaxID=2800325 RepID=A0ABS1EQW6_9CLOT|nr:L,D-transpeptidase family protein [Clostridium yunnanense]